MIFQHTWEKVLSGKKTQTRRIMKSGSAMICREGEIQEAYNGFLPIGRPAWVVGKTYAIQPERGQKAVARIQILSIRQEDVREISEEDVFAEGFFYDTPGFLMTWTKMHDNPALNLLNKIDLRAWVHDELPKRPAERYQAWALTFRVVK